MNVNQLHLISIDLYDRDLVLYVGDWQEMLGQLSDPDDVAEVQTLDSPSIVERGRFILTNSGLLIIWLRGGRHTKETALTLQHEIAHCAFTLLKEIGISFCLESEEAYTYLIGYLTREAWNKLGIIPVSDTSSPE